MAKQLGEVGLAKLVQLLSSKFSEKANKIHDHASSSITSMSGYNSPASGGHVVSTDTLNQAIGKIESTLDERVDLTSAQTIGGNKTFTGHIILASGIELY